MRLKKKEQDALNAAVEKYHSLRTAFTIMGEAVGGAEKKMWETAKQICGENPLRLDHEEKNTKIILVKDNNNLDKL